MRKWLFPPGPPREWRVRYSGGASATSEPETWYLVNQCLAPTRLCCTPPHETSIYVHSEDAEGVVTTIKDTEVSLAKMLI